MGYELSDVYTLLYGLRSSFWRRDVVIFATDNVEIYTKQYKTSCYEQHDGCHDISVHFIPPLYAKPSQIAFPGSKSKIYMSTNTAQNVIAQPGTYLVGDQCRDCTCCTIR